MKLEIKKIKSFNLKSSKIDIFIDGNHVATLLPHNDSINIDVEVGQVIQAKQQFCGSNKIFLNEEDKTLKLDSFLSNNIFITILVLVVLTTIVALFTKFKFFAIFPIIVLLYPLYFVLIARNKYLKLKR